MRILVIDFAASSGGAMTILQSFYKFIRENDTASKHEWIFLLNDTHIKQTKNITLKIVDGKKNSWLNRLRFDFYWGRKMVNGFKPDLLISFQNTYIYGVKCPQLIYVHQSIPFQSVKKFSFRVPEERILAVYQHIIGPIIKRSIRKSDYTIVQTEWMKQAILEQTKINEKKIILARPPVNLVKSKDFNINDFEKTSYFYPANNSVYKNHRCVIEAVKILNNKGIDTFEVIFTISNSGLECSLPSIKYNSYMNYQDVLRQYQRSVLIFPSYIETVGLPLIEAKQFESLILAADTPASREALQGYENSYYFDPFNPEELASLIEKILNGEIYKSKSMNVSTFDSSSGWGEVLELVELFDK